MRISNRDFIRIYAFGRYLRTTSRWKGRNSLGWRTRDREIASRVRRSNTFRNSVLDLANAGDIFPLLERACIEEKESTRRAAGDRTREARNRAKDQLRERERNEIRESLSNAAAVAQLCRAMLLAQLCHPSAPIDAPSSLLTCKPSHPYFLPPFSRRRRSFSTRLTQFSELLEFSQRRARNRSGF